MKNLLCLSALKEQFIRCIHEDKLNSLNAFLTNTFLIYIFHCSHPELSSTVFPDGWCQTAQRQGNLNQESCICQDHGILLISYDNRDPVALLQQFQSLIICS